MFDAILSLCGHGETKDFTAICLIRAVKRSKYNYEVSYTSGDALIGRSRSVAATQFLATNNAPNLIFIDTDILFTIEELDKITAAMQQGYDVIGGAYSVGSGDRLAIRGYEENIIIDGRITEIEYVSTGFMGISRKALETIRDKCPYTWTDGKVPAGTAPVIHQDIGLPLLHKGEWCECYPFFESGATNLPQPFYVSEDWDFCNKARKVGFKTYFHTGVLVDHIKQNVINAEQVLAAHSMPNKVQLSPSVGLLNDLAEFTTKPFEEVKQAVLNYRVKCDKTDDEWMLELAQFNSYSYYEKERLAPLGNLAGLKILDYGCGIGSAAIWLSGRNTVTGYDINKRLVEFANYRVKKNGLVNVAFTSEEPDLSQFDIIVFIDMLEHFEDLQTFLKHIGEKVRPGAKVYHFDAFFDHRTPGHFDHSAKINDYLKAAGLIPFDNLWAVRA